MSQAESFIKQKSNADYVGSQKKKKKNVKLSKRNFKQTRSLYRCINQIKQQVSENTRTFQ